MPANAVKCDCPRCNGETTGLAAAGYRLADVAKVLCLLCKQPIGDLPYNEIKTLARFGQMSFEHKECPPNES